MITPYNSTVPATLTIDGENYVVNWNNGNDLTIYWAEPLCCIYQTDWTTKYLNTFLRAYDSALNSISENAVQNKVVKAELDLKADLTDIWDATLTIQKNWTTIDTFTANSKTNKTVNVTVPTALSDLTNDVVNDWNLTIKRNNTTIAEFSANDATNVIANLSVPEVINNTTTVDSSNALSAAMWKELQDEINHLKSIGRFLSIWECSTGLPQTNPTTLPYQYHTWDYYIIWEVSTANPPVNYRPTWSQYTWVASTTQETVSVAVWNMYVYDGTSWILQLSWWQSYPIDNVLSTTSTNAVENRVITNTLNWKADKVASAVNNDLASLDANWNLVDSWIAKWDVEVTTNKETWSTLTDDTTKYPSSHTVLEAIWSLSTWVVSVNTQTWVVTLDADDISDTNTTNKWTNATEKTTWNWKQDALTLASTPTQWNLVVWWANNKTFADGWSIPVTSVNWNTWAVTVNDIKIAASAPVSPTEWMAWYDTTNDVLKTYNGSAWQEANGNLKIFTLSSTSDTTNAQEAIDRIEAWKEAILKFGDTTLRLTLKSAWVYTFEWTYLISAATSDTSISFVHIDIITSWWTVQTITTATDTKSFLDTQTNYGTVYTPLYNGSPATKKYVDDNKWIQNDTTWTTTTVTKIWAWTSAEYALITPAADTIYYVF